MRALGLAAGIWLATAIGASAQFLPEDSRACLNGNTSECPAAQKPRAPSPRRTSQDAWNSLTPAQKRDAQRNHDQAVQMIERAPACRYYQAQAANVIGMKRGGAPIETSIRWMATKARTPAEKKWLLPVVGAAYYGEAMYSKGPGGFAGFAYDLCMKGDSF